MCGVDIAGREIRSSSKTDDGSTVKVERGGQGVAARCFFLSENFSYFPFLCVVRVFRSAQSVAAVLSEDL